MAFPGPRTSMLALLAALAVAACGSDAPSGPRVGADDVGDTTAPPKTGGPSDPGASATDPPAAPEKLGAPYPIVLMHGMAGFGKIELGPVSVTYFKDVVEDLAKNGENDVYVTIAPPYASSEVRAQAVAKQIDDILARTGKAKVNLVAHSQGGLDARILASPNGLAYGDRIASVTTVATPHHGSKAADVTLGLIDTLPSVVVDEVTGAFLSLLEKTVYDLSSDPALRDQVTLLSEKYMKEVFNPKYVDAPGVTYASYAGRSNLRTGILACDGSAFANDPLKVDVTTPALEPLAVFLEEGGLKVNDGLVTVESAKWGKFEQCVPADHLKEVGHTAPLLPAFDHLTLFRDLVARLRAQGL